MKVAYIEGILIAAADLDAARERWRRAGFSAESAPARAGAIDIVRLGAGAIEIDLCAAGSAARGPLADAVRESSARGGAMIGWVWGASDGAGDRIDQPGAEEIDLPNEDGGARVSGPALAGVFCAAARPTRDFAGRRERIRERCGANPNTADYLEHIVVMTPALDDAIAACEAVGLPCRRIREVAGGARQAFFKLEQTVIEVVGPSRAGAGCWGLAFMCADVRKAVATARSSGLQATEPKAAVQGGLIARIVEPLDGVAIAFMGPRGE
jgi:predicted enzyme related to lactoylglutathione lyase